jgi:hypothetical protein
LGCFAVMRLVQPGEDAGGPRTACQKRLHCESDARGGRAIDCIPRRSLGLFPFHHENRVAQEETVALATLLNCRCSLSLAQSFQHFVRGDRRKDPLSYGIGYGANRKIRSGHAVTDA